MAKRREMETFSLSFLDVICCGFGAVILLLVITKIYEPITIEQSQIRRQGLLALLQEELFQIRGDTAIVNRGLKTVEEELAEEEDLLSRLKRELTAIRGQFAATQDEASIDEQKQGNLLAARQMLTEEMKRLLRLYKRPDDDTTVGGIPVDSEYIIFVLDTSGSMFNGPWDIVIDRISETLAVYPKLKGIQVLNDEGKYMFSTFAGAWMSDSPQARQNILSRLETWEAYSDSSPVEGITEALNTYYDPAKKVSIYVYGDDFPGSKGSIESVARYVDRVNRADASGKRLMRIHAVGFPTQFSGGVSPNAIRFANLMRTLCARNGGTFVAVTDTSTRGRFRIQIPGI